VELLQQKQLPEALELGVWVNSFGFDVREYSGQLYLVQETLEVPVLRLDPRMRCVRSPVELQIQLALPGLEVRGGFLERIEKGIGRRKFDLGQAEGVLHELDALEHGLLWATAAVAIADEVKRVRCAIAIAVVGDGLEGLLHVGLAVVRVGGREVRKHFGAVEALPVEGRQGKLVDQVPRLFFFLFTFVRVTKGKHNVTIFCDKK